MQQRKDFAAAKADAKFPFQINQRLALLKEGRKQFRGDEVDAKFEKQSIVAGCCLGFAVVGERRIRGEVRAEALVDCIRVRMPE